MSEFQDIDKTLAFIRDHAPVLAKAKAERIYLQEYKKSLLAILFQESDGKTVSDRENYALSHEKYLKLLTGLKAAVEQEEALRWQMTSAELRCEVWRTQSANNRYIDSRHT